MSVKDALLTYLRAKFESAERMRDCLNAQAAEHAGTATRRTMQDICNRVTAEDLRGD